MNVNLQFNTTNLDRLEKIPKLSVENYDINARKILSQKKLDKAYKAFEQRIANSAKQRTKSNKIQTMV